MDKASNPIILGLVVLFAMFMPTRGMAVVQHSPDGVVIGALPQETKATLRSETRQGVNDIVVRTMHYGLQRMVLEKDIQVKMRDGANLYVNIFRPAKAGKFPVVLSADIYGKDGTNEETVGFMPTHGVYAASDFAAFESPDPGYWVPNDYVVVKAALRGSGLSGGKLYPLSEDETKDYYELIEWAARQEWSNGNVGTNGISYLAMTQWRVAALNPPHLKAMIPWEGSSDIYRERHFHGGIPEIGFTRVWYQIASKASPGRFIEDIPQAQRDHPLFDQYWRGKTADLSAIKVPMYVGANWSNHGHHTRGTLEGFKQSSSQLKWLEIHGRKEWEYYFSRECLERQKRFFDYFLKGVDNGWLNMPRVRLEVRDRFYEGQVRFEQEWPLARTTYTKLFLDAEKMTLVNKPAKQVASSSYRSDATGEPAENNKFKITFDRDTELTGYMKLKLWVSAEETDDMDLFVGVRKFDAHGHEVHFPDFNQIEDGIVASGWLRVSLRELDPAKSTSYQPYHKYERVSKLKPGEIVPVEIEIWPSSTLFHAGESLELEIQGSDIIDTGYGYHHTQTVNKGKHTIHAGGRYDSYLLVPEILRMN